MTNNGDIVNKILRAGNNHEKEYIVTVNKPVTDEFILKISNGVPILGETTKKCKVVKESVYAFRIILVQGLNRQIRRMCEYFEYEVQKLERVRIMNINLKGIPTGEWRQLLPQEMTDLMAALVNSSSHHETRNTKPETQNPKPGMRNTEPETRNIERGTRNAKPLKKTDRSANPNPKSKELRGQSANSTFQKGKRPSMGGFSKSAKSRSTKR
jgi:23S rRNA pseudouridine2604 synthase